MRKYWKAHEISTIETLRIEGFTLKHIALRFYVTANAIRKALQRHSVIYMRKVQPLSCTPIKVSLDFAISWGISNRVITIQGGEIYLREELLSKLQAFIYINKHRAAKSLPNFQLRL